MAWSLGNNLRKQTLSTVRAGIAVVITKATVSTLHTCGKMSPTSHSPPST